MGLELGCECKKCGYRFGANVGVGLLYPIIYRKIAAKMKDGQFGEQGKKFFEVFPDGAISCKFIVVQCNDCKRLMEVPELTLYVPKEGYDPAKRDREIPWSSACSGKGSGYVSFSELEDHYQLFEKYDHRCSHCNGHTSVVSGFTECMDDRIDRHICCPTCGSMLKINFIAQWD